MDSLNPPERRTAADRSSELPVPKGSFRGEATTEASEPACGRSSDAISRCTNDDPESLTDKEPHNRRVSLIELEQGYQFGDVYRANATINDLLDELTCQASQLRFTGLDRVAEGLSEDQADRANGLLLKIADLRTAGPKLENVEQRTKVIRNILGIDAEIRVANVVQNNPDYELSTAYRELEFDGNRATFDLEAKSSNITLLIEIKHVDDRVSRIQREQIIKHVHKQLTLAEKALDSDSYIAIVVFVRDIDSSQISGKNLELVKTLERLGARVTDLQNLPELLRSIRTRYGS